MKRIRYFKLYLFTFIKRYKLYLFFGVLFCLFLYYLLVNIKNFSTKENLSEGVVGTFTEKDLQDVTVVTNLLSQSLVRMDESGKPVGNLAKEWSVDKEVKNYEFKLRDDIFWSDGTSILSSDLEFLIPGVEASFPDEKTIKFKLTDSYSPFPTLLTKPLLKKGSFLGTGPYEVSKIFYFNNGRVFVSKLILTSAREDLPQITIRFYPSEKIAKNALKVGEVQSIFGISEDKDLVDQKPFTSVSRTNHSQLVTIFYNTKDAILSDENFRLALSFGAPNIPDEEEARTSIPQSSWAFNPEVKDYLGNPELAKASLAKVKNGRDGIIVLTTTNALEEIGQQVVDEWKKIGVKAVLRVESGIPQNFQALLISHDLPLDPTDQYSLWHSTQTQTNISGYSFVRVDKDLEDARKTADLQVRKARYADFQKILLDHSPATFLYFPKTKVIYLRKVEGRLKKVLDLQLRS